MPLYRKQFIEDTKHADKITFALLGSVKYLDALAQSLVSVAFILAPLALVSVIAGTQPFFVFFLALFVSLCLPKVIKEDMQRSTIVVKIIAIVLMFVGIYFINS